MNLVLLTPRRNFIDCTVNAKAKGNRLMVCDEGRNQRIGREVDGQKRVSPLSWRRSGTWDGIRWMFLSLCLRVSSQLLLLFAYI